MKNKKISLSVPNIIVLALAAVALIAGTVMLFSLAAQLLTAESSTGWLMQINIRDLQHRMRVITV